MIGLLIDAQLADSPLEAWLIRLRTKLAWSGLPALFAVRPQDVALKSLLSNFDAAYVDRDDERTAVLNDAITRLLQGKR